MIKKVVMPTLIYGYESWTLSKKHYSRVNATEMMFLRKIERKASREELGIKSPKIKIKKRQLGWITQI